MFSSDDLMNKLVVFFSSISVVFGGQQEDREKNNVHRSHVHI